MRWALIGASDIAATQVLPALRQLGHEPVVVVGSDAERTARYATRNGVGHGTTSIEEALSAGRVDAVYVSTTNERHAAGVHAAVGAGCHVLCEKPLATSLDQARAMVDAAAGAGVVMATNHHLRNSPVIRTLRGLVADGTLGRVVGVRVAHTTLLPERLRGWRLGSEAGAGVVLDLTVHDVDTVRFVTGMEVLEVAAIGVAQGMSGRRGRGGGQVVRPCRRTPPCTCTTRSPRRTRARRSRCSARTASALATDAMSQTPDGEVVLRRADAEDVLVDVGERENLYVRGLRAFAEAVAGHGDPPCTGEDGVRSLAVALAVTESLLTGRRVSLGITGDIA